MLCPLLLLKFYIEFYVQQSTDGNTKLALLCRWLLPFHCGMCSFICARLAQENVCTRARARTRILHSLNSRVRKRFTCYFAMCTVNCMKLVAFLFVALFSLIPNLRLFAMPCMPSIFVSVCVAVHSFIHWGIQSHILPTSIVWTGTLAGMNMHIESNII